MRIELLVPRLGVATEEVTIIEWLVSDNVLVEAGQPVVTVATDKVEVEIEATVAGRLVQAARPEEEYPVGSLIGVIHIAEP